MNHCYRTPCPGRDPKGPGHPRTGYSSSGSPQRGAKDRSETLLEETRGSRLPLGHGHGHTHPAHPGGGGGKGKKETHGTSSTRLTSLKTLSSSLGSMMNFG